MKFKQLLEWIKLNKDYSRKFLHIMGLMMTWLFAFDGITKSIESPILSLICVFLVSFVVIVSCPKVAIEELKDE